VGGQCPEGLAATQRLHTHDLPNNGQSGSGLILGWEIHDAINHHSILLFVVLLVFRFFLF